MLIIKLIRLFFGYVIFTGEGGFYERFINLAARNNINIWDMSVIDGKIKGFTTVKGYKMLRHTAKKSGVKIRVSKRRGLPFFIHAHRHRSGLAAGAAIFFISLYLLSSHIWFIDVKGNDKISSDEVVRQFEELGVKIGMKADDINAVLLQTLAYESYPEYSWLAVNVKGSTATIEVREREEKPYVVDKNKPCNIVAKTDGVIIRLEPYVGKREVEDGYPVLRGEMLINGITQNEDKSSVLRHAQGRCIASTRYTIESFVPFGREIYAFNGKNSSKYSLYFLGRIIPLGVLRQPGENYKSYVKKSFLTVDGVRLPFGLIKEQNKAYGKTTQTLSRDEAAILAKQDFDGRVFEKLNGAEIVGKSVRYEFTAQGVTIKGEFVCTEDIAAQEVIQTE